MTGNGELTDYYEYRHTVGFEETNLVGNVYYVNYLRWQGRCRELFLHQRCPQVLAELQDDLKLFTLKVDCEFFAEITAFDQLSIRMRLAELAQTQLEFTFDYLKLSSEGELLVARGRQRVACMRGPNGRTEPTRVPEPLVRALAPSGRAAPGRAGGGGGRRGPPPPRWPTGRSPWPRPSSWTVGSCGTCSAGSPPG